MNLASERVRLDMTQQDMAEKLECTVKTLGKWEKDISTMPGKALLVAAALFGCSVDYLLDKTDERTASTKGGN